MPSSVGQQTPVSPSESHFAWAVQAASFEVVVVEDVFGDGADFGAGATGEKTGVDSSPSPNVLVGAGTSLLYVLDGE